MTTDPLQFPYADHVADVSSPEIADRQGQPKKSQATFLVELVTGDEQVELFHTPGGHDSEGYVSIPVARHYETWSINSKGFRRWISLRFFRESDKVPRSQAVQEALGVLSGLAIYKGLEHAVAVRLAEYDGDVWFDLCDREWRAVRITSEGWTVVEGSSVPVRFIRRRGMLALPTPRPGGTIDEFRQFVNVPDDGAWVLLVAWLVMAMRPRGPYPVLCLNGEQGTAKSTLSRFARSLIDPNTAPLRRPPRDERDLMIAACNSWVVSYDNVSRIWERTEELRHLRDSLTQLRAETKKLRRQRALLRQYSKILASFTADRADRTGPAMQANMRRARAEVAEILAEIDDPSFFGELLLKAFGITEEPRNTAGANLDRLSANRLVRLAGDLGLLPAGLQRLGVVVRLVRPRNRRRRGDRHE